MTLTSKFDKFQNDGTGKKAADPASDEKCVENYNAAGSTRNVCFVQLDGRSKFLNYAYLISADFDPNESTIRIGFTTHNITIKGYHLNELFENLKFQLPSKIICMDKRYMATKDDKEAFIAEISIGENKQS